MTLDSLHSIDYILIGILGFFFLAQLYFYARYMCAVARRIRKGERRKAEGERSEVPGVSVILCAHNESENLSNYLQALLTQDYPTYEVIVVDDGSEDDTRLVIERYMVHDPRLHMTFVPYGARVRSTKKLALTLAAKAAQYDYLLLTDADCVPESNQWISSMMAGFTPNKDIVLGFGAYFKEKGCINRLVRFDTLFNGLHYLGAAICGHPYMGVGRNLAYRKSLFFESGGFTHMMDNRAGDDDLFVNHVANKKNTAVAVRPESYTWSLAKTTLRDWWKQKRRHLSVSPKYRLSTKIRLALEPMTRGWFYAFFIGMMVFYWPTCLNNIPIPFIAAAGLFLLRWIMQTLVINISARRMGVHRFNMFSILWFDITLPLVNLWMLLIPKKQYKW